MCFVRVGAWFSIRVEILKKESLGLGQVGFSQDMLLMLRVGCPKLGFWSLESAYLVYLVSLECVFMSKNETEGLFL